MSRALDADSPSARFVLNRPADGPSFSIFRGILGRCYISAWQPPGSQFSRGSLPGRVSVLVTGKYVSRDTLETSDSSSSSSIFVVFNYTILLAVAAYVNCILKT